MVAELRLNGGGSKDPAAVCVSGAVSLPVPPGPHRPDRGCQWAPGRGLAPLPGVTVEGGVMLECVGWRCAEVVRSFFGVTPDEPRRSDDPGPNPRILSRHRPLGRWCLCRLLRGPLHPGRGCQWAPGRGLMPLPGETVEGGATTGGSRRCDVPRRRGPPPAPPRTSPAGAMIRGPIHVSRRDAGA